jgi:hypothetical protein
MEKLQSKWLQMKKTMILVFLFITIISIAQIVIAFPDLEVTFETNITEATPGTQGYIILNLKSIGSSNVEGIQVEAISVDYWEIKPLGDWEISLGDLSSSHSTSAVFNYKVSSSVLPGLYEIKFIIKTTNAGYITQYATIKVEDFEVLDITSVDPHSIKIGEETILVFNITNNGGSSAENILFTWKDSSDLILPVGTDNRITISSIPAGNYTEIPVDVVASPAISPGVYPLTITMEFYDRSGTKQTITSEVGIQVNGTTDFEIVLQESMGGGTTFAIANTGANVASSVIVSIPRQGYFMTSDASSVSLGNLDAGDYTLATFQISSVEQENNTQRPDKSSMEAPFDLNFSRPESFRGPEFGSNNLIVEVSYTDLFGVRQAVEKEVEFSSSSSSSIASRSSDKSGLRPGESTGLDSGTMYIIIGVIGIIAIVAILKIGKRKKK